MILEMIKVIGKKSLVVPMGSAIMHQLKRLHNLMLSSLFMTKVRFHFIEQESILA